MKRTLILFAVLVVSSDAYAQNTGTGFPQFGSMQTGNVDVMNLQNLNAHFEIPIVSVPGRGSNFAYSLVYDSLVWYQYGSPTAWTPVIGAAGTPSWGWQQNNVVGALKYLTQQVDCVTGGGGKGDGRDHYSTEKYGFTYTDAAGTVHRFGLDYYTPATVCGFPTGPTAGYAGDGSGYYISGNVVYSPGGRQIASAVQSKDLNGNEISAAVNGSVTTWTDTAGHTVLVIDSSSNPILYKYQDTSGASQQIRVTTSTLAIKTNFQCSGVVEYTGVATVPT